MSEHRPDHHAWPTGPLPPSRTTDCDHDRSGFERLFALASDLLCIASFDGMMLAVSPSWTDTLGWTEQELTATPYLDLVHPDDVAATIEVASGLTRGEPIVRFENRYRHRDGSYRWFQWSSVAAVDERHIYAIVRDVTDASEEREGLRHFRDLVELSEEGIVELDADGRITYANRRLAAMLGETPDGLLGRVAVDLLAEGRDDVLARITAPWTSAIGPVRTEVRLRHRSGTTAWVQVAAQAHHADDGTATGISAVITDVSAAKRREAELTTARRHLEEAHQLARLGRWWDDQANAVLTWSPMVYTIFGVDPATFTPTRDAVRALIHPDDLPDVRASRREGLTSGHHEVTYRIRRPDGVARIVHELARVESDAAGRPVSTGTVQDVTALTQAELALRDSEERLQRVLRATNDGWWDHDLRTDETFHSDRFLAIHGYTRADVEESPLLWRTLTHPDDLPVMDEVVTRAFERRDEMFTVSGRIRHKHGHLVPIVGRGFIEYDEHGTPVRMSGSTTDVTEVLHAERAKEEFVSTVSHELRTPLTSIGGALEMLDAGVTGPLDPAAHQLLTIARRNTDRLRRLIDDLLDMERLLTGRLRFELADLELAGLVDQAVTDIGLYADRHEVTVEFAARADGILVHVDRERLHQVLANLLSNAVKYAPVGSVVQVAVRAVDDRAHIEVVDRGPGVPDDFAPRLFQRFEQADPSDARSRGGTGLGLAITREIVERFHGSVSHRSRPGHTCFIVDLPVAGRSAAAGRTTTAAGRSQVTDTPPSTTIV